MAMSVHRENDRAAPSVSSAAGRKRGTYVTTDREQAEAEYAVGRGYKRTVFRFMLKGGNWWNWPVEGRSSIAAFRELLDRAEVVYTERDD